MSREQAKKHDIQLIWRPFQVLLPNFSCFKGPFACTIKADSNNMCVTGSDKLLRGNQIDWVIEWVSWFQVFCKEIKSNTVSKLFILVWRYEGMKVLDLGYENSYENFSITPICHIFSNFPAVFHYAQGMNRQVWNMDLTHLERTHHIDMVSYIVTACNRTLQESKVLTLSLGGGTPCSLVPGLWSQVLSREYPWSLISGSLRGVPLCCPEGGGTPVRS